MHKLSYTQEYFMCVVNEKGVQFPSPLDISHNTITLCFVVGGIMELIKHGFVTYDEDKLVVAKSLDEDFSYLKPLYDDISSKLLTVLFGGDIKGVARGFWGEYTTRYLDLLLSAIGKDLMEKGYADELPAKGFLFKKIRYAPKAELVTSIIEKIRVAFLGDGDLDENTLSLVAMLDKSGIINGYFNQDELKAIKDCLEEVRSGDKYALLKDVRKVYDSLEEEHDYWLFGMIW